MQAQRARLLNAHRHMRNTVQACQEKRTSHLRSLLQLYNSLNYTSVLARGFVIVRDASDQPLAKAAAVGPGAGLTLQFADGRVTAGAQGEGGDRKSTRLNSSHIPLSRMPSSA